MITAPPENLQSVIDQAFAGISRARDAFAPKLTPQEVGTISSIVTGIAKVSGLPGVGFEEFAQFPGDVLGIAFNVDEDEIGVVLLGEYRHLHAGDEVRRTGWVMDVAVLREKGAMDYTVVVVTEGNDPPGLAYIAPYAATGIAEYFMEAGRDVLIVYDDLTHHARAYRELSLLLRRPPGREAFPADLFDPVPLERMTDAEQAVREVSENLPAEVRQRLETADKLSEEDRETFLESARNALAEFSSEPVPNGPDSAIPKRSQSQ